MAKVNKHSCSNDKLVVHNYKDGGLVEKLREYFIPPPEEVVPIDPSQPVHSDSHDWYDNTFNRFREGQGRGFPPDSNLPTYGQSERRTFRSSGMHPEVNKDIPLYPIWGNEFRSYLEDRGPNTQDAIPNAEYTQDQEKAFGNTSIRKRGI